MPWFLAWVWDEKLPKKFRSDHISLTSVNILKSSDGRSTKQVLTSEYGRLFCSSDVRCNVEHHPYRCMVDPGLALWADIEGN